MIVVFTTIFTAYSVIEDRRGGFLQGVLASPAPRLAIALGKVGGGAVIATLQGLLMLAFWPVVGPWPGLASMLAAAAMLAVIAVMMTCVGFALAWPMSSSAGFHAVLNLTIFPMWLMSGAVFAYGSAAPWQKVIMALNPLTYAQTAFATALHGGGGDWHGPLPAPWCALVAAACTAVMLWTCAVVVGRRRVSQ
jgi:ABC-2 type transport system permease protein